MIKNYIELLGEERTKKIRSKLIVIKKLMSIYSEEKVS